MIVANIKIEPSIEEIRERLGELRDKAPTVLRKSLNDTATWTGKELAREAQKRYRVKTKKFAKEFSIARATNNHLTATLTASGEPLAASKFQISPTKPVTSGRGSPAAKLAILKEESPQRVTNAWGLDAFITEYGSGHTAIVQRRPGKYYKSKGWAARRSKWSEYLRRTGRLDKTKIKELYGPSVPTMLKETGVTKEYLESKESKIMEYLKKAVNKHIQTEMHFAGKGKGR